jgi:hypothetical protein
MFDMHIDASTACDEEFGTQREIASRASDVKRHPDGNQRRALLGSQNDVIAELRFDNVRNLADL